MLLLRCSSLRSSTRCTTTQMRRGYASAAQPSVKSDHNEIADFVSQSVADVSGLAPMPIRSLLTGEPVKSVELPPDVFGTKVRTDILHRVVIWKLACMRKGTGSAKTRGEMSGTKKKVAAQKGGGRARIGNLRTPVRRGGGTAFPPKPRDFTYTLPKKVRLLGLKCALAAKFAQNKLVILENFDVPTLKTGELNKILKGRGWDNVLFVDGAEPTPYFFLASRNLPHVSLLSQSKANVYDILKRKYLVLNQESLDHLIKRVNGQLPTISKRAARAKKQRRKKAQYKIAAPKIEETPVTASAAE